MNNSFIKHFIGSVSDFAHKIKKDSMNPTRDWVVLMMAVVIFGISFLSFNTFIFFKVSKGEIFTIKNNSEIPLGVIDRKRIDSVLEDFLKREERSALIKSEMGKLVDPAL
jgi:hypothetical protein